MFFESIFLLISFSVLPLTTYTVDLINFALDGVISKTLIEFDFNLYLFGDNPIFQMNLQELFTIIFAVFYFIFFIVLLWKGTKKVISMIFGVFKV